jgi:hypothetical protein
MFFFMDVFSYLLAANDLFERWRLRTAARHGCSGRPCTTLRQRENEKENLQLTYSPVMSQELSSAATKQVKSTSTTTAKPRKHHLNHPFLNNYRYRRTHELFC